jgi:hypothetical protein
MQSTIHVTHQLLLKINRKIGGVGDFSTHVSAVSARKSTTYEQKVTDSSVRLRFIGVLTSSNFESPFFDAAGQPLRHVASVPEEKATPLRHLRLA